MKEYFSHDYNARNDPELVNILMKKKLSGIGLFWCIVEMLYESNGYIMLSECERIAFELRIDKDEINDLISNENLFKTDKKRFWSESVLKRLALRNEKSEKAKRSATIRWNNANALQTQSESNAIKVNKRKVNKIKLKEDIIIPTESEFINYISENSKECDLNAAKLKYKSWVENGWKDGNSQPIINWKSKALNIIPYLPKKEANLFNRVQTAKHDSDY